MKFPLRITAALLALLAASLLSSCAGNGAAPAVSTASPPASASPAAPAISPTIAPASVSPSSPPPSYSDAVHDDASLLFGQYSWSTSKFLGSFEMILPESFVTNVEDTPMQFYWLRADVLSGDIGLGLKPYLGQPVTLKVYEVAGTQPEKYTHPALVNTRGLVVRNSDGRIVAAYIDTGRHAGVSYSLAGHDVEDVTGLSLAAYWEKNYFDPNDPVNKAAAARTAEEVITRYFEGMADDDTAKQLSTLSLERKLESLFTNMDNNLPFNMDPELYHYLVDVKVLSIKKPGDETPGEPVMYGVDIDAKLTEEARQVLDRDGKLTRFVSVGEENGILRVFSDGTGP